MDPNQLVTPTPEKATGANKYLQPYKSRRAIILDNFLGGLFWSLGTFLGLAILAATIGFFISKINLVPIIGSWIAKILEDATSRIQPPIWQVTSDASDFAQHHPEAMEGWHSTINY